jgi:hypothetical protein
MPATPRVAILEKQGGVLSWHRDLEAGFRARGAEVFSLQLRPASLAEYRAKWRSKQPALQNPEIIARVASELRAARPDLVLVLKQPGLPASALEAWRAAAPRAPVVAWICDHLTTWPTALAAALDGVCHFDSATRPLLEQAYAGTGARLIHLPLAADPARYPALALPFEARRPALVFAGNNSHARKAQLDAYRAGGGRVESFGPGSEHGWRFWQRRHLDASRLSALYGSYFGVLNLLQAPNTLHGLNLRAFEAPVAGALATYPLVPDLASAFVPGEELVAYRDLEDLKTQIDTLLTRPARAAEIAAAGRARVLREHTFAHRAERFLADWLA